MTEKFWKKHEKPDIKKTKTWSRSKLLLPVMTLVYITHYTNPNYTDRTQVNIHWIHRIENIFTVQDFSATCACPERESFPRKFFTVLNIFFTIQDFWSTLCLPWKTEFAQKLLAILIILFTFRIFEELALALKKRECPGFTVLNIYFCNDVRWGSWLGRHCLRQSYICEYMDWTDVA